MIVCRRVPVVSKVVSAPTNVVLEADDCGSTVNSARRAAGTSAATVWRVSTRFGLKATSSVKEVDEVTEEGF